MGKVKNYAMDLEDRFWENAYHLVGLHDTYHEFEDDLIGGYQHLLNIQDMDQLETIKMMLREIYMSDWNINVGETHGNA